MGNFQTHTAALFTLVVARFAASSGLCSSSTPRHPVVLIPGLYLFLAYFITNNHKHVVELGQYLKVHWIYQKIFHYHMTDVLVQ